MEQHVLSEFDYDGPFFDQLVEFSGILYTYDTPSSISENGETTIYQIDKSNIDIGLKQVHTFETPEDMFSTTPCIVSRGRLIYVDAEHNLCMYSFSENQEVKLAEIAHYSSLHSMALLGDYVYFEDDHRVFKIDLSDFSLSEVVGKEDCE